MKISFVIPCYRSERTIGGVVEEIRSVMEGRPKVEYEVVLVSDHSPDGVYGVIERLATEDPGHVRGAELARNFGQHAALMAGYAMAKGDLVFSMDDDGQAPVDAVFELVARLAAGPFDVVYGDYPVKKHNPFRNFGSWLNGRMFRWLVGAFPNGVKGSSFYVARRFVIDEMLRYSGPYPYLGGLVYRTTCRIGSVEVNHRERTIGTSGYTFGKLLGLWLNGFTAFSVKPLRLASWCGLACAAVGFGAGLAVVAKKLFVTPDMPLGYSSLICTLLFVGGMLMLMLGLVGEYIGRIYISINRAPQYVVARTCGGREMGREKEEGT